MDAGVQGFPVTVSRSPVRTGGEEDIREAARLYEQGRSLASVGKELGFQRHHDLEATTFAWRGHAG